MYFLVGFPLVILIFGSIGFVTGMIFAAWDKRSGILSSPKRFLWYLLGLAVLFLALFGDEIIGKIQFDYLCRNAEFKLMVPPEKLKDKNLVSEKQKWETSKIFFISHNYSSQNLLEAYEDPDTHATYFIAQTHWAPQGRVAKIVSLGNTGSLLFPELDNGFCKNPQYYELEKRYGFSVIFNTKPRKLK